MPSLEFKALEEKQVLLLISMSNEIIDKPKDETSYKIYRKYRDSLVLQGYNISDIKLYDQLVKDARE